MGTAAYSNLAHPSAFGSPDQDDRATSGPTSTGKRQQTEMALPSRLVRAVQTARRRRVALFDADLFSDPVWDILLELYALHLEQQRASVSGLYVASYVPASTALRWIAKLEHDGLVVRREDTTDARRNWIELTPDGLMRMSRYFEMLPLATISI